MDETLDLGSGQLLTLIMLHKLTQSLSNFKKIPFWHVKGKSMNNFYISNALGQNLANSESYSEIGVRGQNM